LQAGTICLIPVNHKLTAVATGQLPKRAHLNDQNTTTYKVQLQHFYHVH
jgi:hypothetical protein